MESGKRQYLLRTVGRFADIEELEQLILARRNDQIIRLRDVAEVTLDHFESRSTSLYNGGPHIMMAVRREAGSNVLDIKAAMLAAIDELNKNELKPAGLQMS